MLSIVTMNINCSTLICYHRKWRSRTTNQAWDIVNIFDTFCSWFIQVRLLLLPTWWNQWDLFDLTRYQLWLLNQRRWTMSHCHRNWRRKVVIVMMIEPRHFFLTVQQQIPNNHKKMSRGREEERTQNTKKTTKEMKKNILKLNKTRNKKKWSYSSGKRGGRGHEKKEGREETREENHSLKDENILFTNQD